MNYICSCLISTQQSFLFMMTRRLAVIYFSCVKCSFANMESMLLPSTCLCGSVDCSPGTFQLSMMKWADSFARLRRATVSNSWGM